MFARLRQKVIITSQTATANSPNANSLGNIATSLLIKDIARIANGYITTTSDLNSEIWDIANCEVVRTVDPGWQEYQYRRANTNYNLAWSGMSTANATPGMFYFRTPNSANTTNGQPIYKYFGLGLTNTAVGYTFNIYYPHNMTAADFTGNPNFVFGGFINSGTTVSARGRYPYGLDVLNEFIIYCTPRVFFISSQTIGTTTASKVSMFLEYPKTALSDAYNLPNQVWFETASQRSANTTGSNFVGPTFMYNIAGGYKTSNPGEDINGSVAYSQNNDNFALVYTYAPALGTVGTQSLYSANPATADLSTFKPANNTTMSVTVDSAGNSLTIPVMPLLHWPAWDSVYDCSSLTGIYATKSNLGSSGDTLFINGVPYVYVNVSSMSYLVPKQ